MKHMVKIAVVLVLLFSVTGCNNSSNVTNRAGNGNNNVDKIINEQIGKAEGKDNSADLKKEASSGPKNSSEKSGSGSAKVDYDLTSMGSDMVYATVYQMMVDPDTYVGKTFRMEGLYSPIYYKPTKKYYHSCMIQDALSCCAQGMEFVWGDGSHIYPEEYPEENAKIVVQGVFETYKEEGDATLYCRLKDATMEVIKE